MATLRSNSTQILHPAVNFIQQVRNAAAEKSHSDKVSKMQQKPGFSSGDNLYSKQPSPSLDVPCPRDLFRFFLSDNRLA